MTHARPTKKGDLSAAPYCMKECKPVTTIIPEQPSFEQSVYIGGQMDWSSQTLSGGSWSQSAHGGVCQGRLPEPAVIGSHLHWNGDYYMACPLREHCPEPSCHPADEADFEETRQREIALAEEATDDDAEIVFEVPA